tara:strand:- start:401 stop:1168 length:768 start_codon:yes stop_codon:yes gene_type:complete
MALTYGIVWADFGAEKKETASAEHALGTKMVLPDGRTFYYAKNSSAAITSAGMIVDGIAAVAAHDMDVPPTAAQSVGDNTVSLEVPTTDLTKDQYKDGYLIFNDADGEGEVYRIVSHPAHDASDDATVIITIEDEGLQTAITTSTEAQLIYNPYTDVKLIDGDGTMTTGPLGVTTIPVTASYYCWLQTSGIASVAIGAQVGVLGDGLSVSQESGESGLAERADYSDESDLRIIGTAMSVASVNTDKQVCMLDIRS